MHIELFVNINNPSRLQSAKTQPAAVCFWKKSAESAFSLLTHDLEPPELLSQCQCSYVLLAQELRLFLSSGNRGELAGSPVSECVCVCKAMVVAAQLIDIISEPKAERSPSTR